jgi:hypothetical protein
MSENINIEYINELIGSENKEKILQGLELIEKHINFIPAESVEDVIASLFFIDLGDHPEMIDVKDKAIKVLSKFGTKIISYCIKSLEDTDLKAALDFARVLGLVGEDAVEPLTEEYHNTSNPDAQSFILYAISKVRDKAVIKALPLIVSAVSSQNDEIRDTASRTIGKIFEVLEPSDVDDILVETVFNMLMTRIADNKGPIRAKAVRSLGKMAKGNFLSDAQKEKLKNVCLRILGKDEKFECDRAFIVRKEAKETLKYL